MRGALPPVLRMRGTVMPDYSWTATLGEMAGWLVVGLVAWLFLSRE